MANTVADIINEAFVALSVIQPGGTISSNMLNDAFLRLNQMWLSWGSEEATSNVWYSQTFTLTAGTATYTVGTGGTLVATASPVRILSWFSKSGNFSGGGPVVGFEAFDSIAKDDVGSSSVIAKAVGSDNAYSPTNIKVFPTPAATPGTLTLDYYAPMTAFTSTSQSLALAPWFENALWLGLAVLLHPQYARANWDPKPLFDMATSAKSTIVARNRAVLDAGKAA